MPDGSVLSLLLAAGFVGTFGVLIRYAGMVQLIAGYDPERVADEAGLAAFVGRNVLLVAVLTLLVAIVEYAAPFAGAGLVWIGYVLGVVVIAGWTIVGARRYEKPA